MSGCSSRYEWHPPSFRGDADSSVEQAAEQLALTSRAHRREYAAAAFVRRRGILLDPPQHLLVLVEPNKIEGIEPAARRRQQSTNFRSLCGVHGVAGGIHVA